MFILHIVWELLTATNEDVIHYLSELFFSVTLANLGQKGCVSCLSNELSGGAMRKVVQQLYMAVLPHPLLTLTC